MFLAPIFWWELPEFLDLRYKAHPIIDDVAKFHGDRSRDFGERVAKKNKKNIRSKT